MALQVLEIISKCVLIENVTLLKIKRCPYVYPITSLKKLKFSYTCNVLIEEHLKGFDSYIVK